MAVAGSITVTTSDLGRGYTKYSLAWVCSAGGAVTEVATPFQRGHFEAVRFIPDAAGTQPTDAYDITLLDAISGGADYLTGLGANLSNANRKIGAPETGDGTTALQRVFFEGGNLYLTVANAGTSKGGTVEIVMRP